MNSCVGIMNSCGVGIMNSCGVGIMNSCGVGIGVMDIKCPQPQPQAQGRARESGRLYSIIPL